MMHGSQVWVRAVQSSLSNLAREFKIVYSSLVVHELFPTLQPLSHISYSVIISMENVLTISTLEFQQLRPLQLGYYIHGVESATCPPYSICKEEVPPELLCGTNSCMHTSSNTKILTSLRINCYLF